jgi:hypothetical protein
VVFVRLAGLIEEAVWRRSCSTCSTFFCLSSFRLSDSFDGIHGPISGDPGFRSFVPARLYRAKQEGSSTAARKALRYEVSGDANNTPIVKVKGSVTVG